LPNVRLGGAPEYAAALARAIQTLAADPALWESLGAAGYLYAQAHLDSEAVLGRFEGDLRAVVGV
jgi:colanic acid biosynthesis glycosyl transferase WcaI